MNHQFLKSTIFTFLFLLVFTGCGKQAVEPIAIDESTHTCEICNMQVKDNPFATELILENGKALVFDDIGCMNKWVKENSDKKVDASFVRDYSTSEWIDTEKAIYVYGKSIKTPMAYNVISFSTEEAAQNFIDENEGTLLTHADLKEHSWERNKEMIEEMKKMKMNGESGKEHMEMSEH